VPTEEPADEHANDGGDVERYEQLRRRALDGEASGWRLGLALLQRRGVAAWTKAWHTTAPVAPVPPPVAAPVDGDGVVGVLATMALACLSAG
jgi:hypothetical protein